MCGRDVRHLALLHSHVHANHLLRLSSRPVTCESGRGSCARATPASSSPSISMHSVRLCNACSAQAPRVPQLLPVGTPPILCFSPSRTPSPLLLTVVTVACSRPASSPPDSSTSRSPPPAQSPGRSTMSVGVGLWAWSERRPLGSFAQSAHSPRVQHIAWAVRMYHYQCTTADTAAERRQTTHSENSPPYCSSPSAPPAHDQHVSRPCCPLTMPMVAVVAPVDVCHVLIHSLCPLHPPTGSADRSVVPLTPPV